MRDSYKMEYTGRLEVEDLDPVGYKVSLYLGRAEAPLVLIADLEDDDFVAYIKEELRSRKLQKTQYSKAIKLPPEPYNTCYERRRIDRQNGSTYCRTCL